MRYLTEGTPSLRDVAKVTVSLADARLEAGGLIRCQLLLSLKEDRFRLLEDGNH